MDAAKNNASRDFFRPRARLVMLLGEQLISDSAVGLVELVKNAYDADATRVQILLEGLSDVDSTTLVVSDNGHGMTPWQVRNHWLSPATGNKESSKKRAERTKMGRQFIGEKGVGRFAVQRLGRRIKLYTRAAGKPEVQVEIDWSDFEEQEAFLDEVSVDIRTAKHPRHFLDGETGTRIEMYGARTAWTGVELRKVQRMLRRLQNPLRAIDDFQVGFSCPEFPAYEDIDPAGILSSAHYTFSGEVNADGVLGWSYNCALPGAEKREADGEDRLVDLIGEELVDGTPSCGSFRLHLHVWDRSREMMRASDLTDRELNAHCGISVYRDGFRVLPYGEAGNDWLGLDARRINVPSRRVGNRNIVGVVELSHDENVNLKDRTSREGLIENRAYEDLCALVRGAIMVFEVERLRDRTAGTSDERMGATLALESTEEEASAQTSFHSVYSSTGKVSLTTPDPVPASPLQQTRGFVSRALDRKITEERHEELYTLAAAGLRLEKLEHQFSTQAHQALIDLGVLKRKLATEPELLSRLSSVETGLNVLKNAIRALAPDGPVSQSERTSEFGLGEAIEAAFRPLVERIEEHGVMLEVSLPGDDVVLRGRQACVTQVLGIVFDNAVYWATRSRKDAMVRVGWNEEEETLVVGDSGPGVDVRHRERIFEPYFALRPDGRGLGLHIARDLIEHQGGALYLVAPEESSVGLDGATFHIRIPTSEAKI